MIASDARILWSLLRGHPNSGDHAADLSAFYAGQADAYDRFRDRLLPGRAELFAELAGLLPANASLVELGAGTGRNLAWLGAGVAGLARADLVDLCDPLLDKARQRWRSYPQVRCHSADACRWQPESPVDAVILAYALTMIPDWRAAIANAVAMLKPGGHLAVIDFTITAEQSRMVRKFWRYWFGHDGVRLDMAHVETLGASLPDHTCLHRRVRLPYLPGLRPIVFAWLGCKRG